MSAKSISSDVWNLAPIKFSPAPGSIILWVEGRRGIKWSKGGIFEKLGKSRRTNRDYWWVRCGSKMSVVWVDKIEAVAIVDDPKRGQPAAEDQPREDLEFPPFRLQSEGLADQRELDAENDRRLREWKIRDEARNL